MIDSDFDVRCTEFTPAEWHAMEVHRYYLSERAGHDVGIAATVEDWLLHYSAQWRKERLREDLADQTKEIMKHKWIESEKAGADLGDSAVFDWLKKHAGEWRQWREKRS